MRIAFVAPFGLRAKGTTRARVVPLARALAERGHTVAVFMPPYDSLEDSGKDWEEGGVWLMNVALPNGWPGLGMFWQLHVAWRLLNAVRCWKPDLVHVFKPKGPSGLVGAALCLQRPGVESRIAQISHPRRDWRLVVDSDDWEGDGGWNDDPRAGYSLLMRRFFAWQERFGLSHADAWTVTGACLRDRAISFGAEPSRVFLLPNGISTGGEPDADADDAHRREGSQQRFALDHPPSAILYTRFAGVKAEEVTGIWRRVRLVIPNAQLTVLGRGLASEEQTLGDVDGIDVRGWLEPEEMSGHFASAQLAIVPWADTPSNRARHSAKVLELMAASLSIVAYAVGELPATLGDTGILVTPGDQAAFARAVVSLFTDGEMARHLGVTARRRAVSLFSWRRLADTALEAYRATGTSQPV
jgi:glycosyltransferase involved in cell wall biosynthesis